MSLSTLDIVLAGLNVHRDLRDAITGDLIEERATVAALQGDGPANRWMRQQVVLSILQFVIAAVREGGVRLLIAAVGAALTALLAIWLSIGLSAALVSQVLSPETIRRLTIVAVAIDLACGTAGGYLAARLGRAAPLGAAFLFGIFGVLLTLTLAGESQGWSSTTLSVLLVPATLTGGWLQARHLARRAHLA